VQEYINNLPKGFWDAKRSVPAVGLFSCEDVEFPIFKKDWNIQTTTKNIDGRQVKRLSVLT